MECSQTSVAGAPCLLQSAPPHYHHHHSSCPLSFPHHHHHHYHIHFSPHCPLHSRLIQPDTLVHACPSSLQLPHPSPSQVPESGEIYPCDALMMQGGNEGAIEEDEEDPVFVLTDEWREFFAKSEAKRRSAKKQAKKKGKEQQKAQQLS
ncbi:hypothetical protein NMG60_11034478 [Bertholletia excelsa]